VFEIRIQEDPEQLALAAVEEFAELAVEAIGARSRFLVALAGGNTPQRMYTLLASEPWTSRVGWGNVHVFWGDERDVPVDHADSNYGMAREALLDRVNIPEDNIHNVPTSMGPVEAAADYERVIREFGNPPHFDLILLGMGTDGHTASLFPQSALLQETERLVAAEHVAGLDAWRISMTPLLINAAQTVLFLVSGKAKAERIYQVFHGEHDPLHIPAQAIQPREGELIWLLDEAAASLLPGN
jgi:6-phosphogluconolactonase